VQARLIAHERVQVGGDRYRRTYRYLPEQPPPSPEQALAMLAGHRLPAQRRAELVEIVRAALSRAGQAGAGQVGPGQVGVGQAGPSEAGSGQAGAGQPGTGQAGANKAAATRAEPAKAEPAGAESTMGAKSAGEPGAGHATADEAGLDRLAIVRLQQRERDAVRALAEMAIEVEELVANEASGRAVVHTVRALTKLAELRPIERAGQTTRFDRARHTSVGGRIPDGAPVLVLRPGYTWNSPDGEILIARAVVQDRSPQ
jgi:hypothetical protein